MRQLAHFVYTQITQFGQFAYTQNAILSQGLAPWETSTQICVYTYGVRSECVHSELRCDRNVVRASYLYERINVAFYGTKQDGFGRWFRPKTKADAMESSWDGI